MHDTERIARLNQTERMIGGLSDPEPFLGHREPLCERAEFGMAIAQPGPGGRRDDVERTKAFIAQIPLEGRHILLQTLYGPRIVSPVVIGIPQDQMRPGLEADIAQCGAHGQGMPTVGDGTVDLACHPEIVAHGGIDPPEPQLIAERLGEGLSTA
jgi:hypothetical protein